MEAGYYFAGGSTVRTASGRKWPVNERFYCSGCNSLRREIAGIVRLSRLLERVWVGIFPFVAALADKVTRL